MIKDPYIGMPIIMGDGWNRPGQGCCSGGQGGQDQGGQGGQGDQGQDDWDQHDFGQTKLDDLPLAISYVPYQRWNKTYPLATALARGTVFPALDLPFEGGQGGMRR